ncbi:unnamed protein product [Acanthoscelides obtectus]|uniref:Uncharacterized protein n=1 Tax=Acanthoscelides obtectus TaxID=200917 RepID=A0A9P0LNX1_ACAOB|nr:unnamed protein product [Acanthoscelides obtectus]CAK1624140.1 hypothetical protein AOBTE_LOCUS2346 [Acanthoscelides obtectus]
MKVKVAAQQLSHSVSAAIETFSVLGDFPAELLHTAEFSSTIDDLFDSLNGSTITAEGVKKYKCCLSGDSPHLDFRKSMLCKINKWRVIDSETGLERRSYKFIDGWQITIKAVIMLWECLRAKGFKFLALRNLNQDPIENIIGQIRQHGVCNSNPSCHQFIVALKTIVINKFSTPLTRNGTGGTRRTTVQQ